MLFSPPAGLIFLRRPYATLLELLLLLSAVRCCGFDLVSCLKFDIQVIRLCRSIRHDMALLPVADTDENNDELN